MPRTDTSIVPADDPTAPAYDWAPPVARAPQNVLAWVSLGVGIGAVFLGVLASVAAVICGHLAFREIRARGEQGEAAARWGLILGYAGIALTSLLVLAWLMLLAGSVSAGTAQ